MKIQILGTGCSKCGKTQEIVQKVVEQEGLNATIEKVEDIVEIMKFDVMTTPAVVVDGQVKIKGKVPTEAEVLNALK